MVEPEPQANQVLVSESYLQSLLAQIAVHGGIPLKYPQKQRPGHSISGLSKTRILPPQQRLLVNRRLFGWNIILHSGRLVNTIHVRQSEHD